LGPQERGDHVERRGEPARVGDDVDELGQNLWGECKLFAGLGDALKFRAGARVGGWLVTSAATSSEVSMPVAIEHFSEQVVVAGERGEHLAQVQRLQ
jgi:hypothetical protein